MPETISRGDALYGAFILVGLAFIAGHIHGGYRMFRWGMGQREDARHWQEHAADVEGRLYAEMKRDAHD